MLNVRDRGHFDDAERDIAEAIAISSTTGELHFVAELHRRRGVLAMARSQRDEAVVGFDNALRAARERGHRLYELRAATSLARLWAEEGERGKEAHGGDANGARRFGHRVVMCIP